ncbi:hypothetical protein OG948_21215 [Embleya sp. NBC_00888]|uniref:hypothetical protein n=1 Tax=Embleya sp. NBC_00888 TaxID=2975960 RepID=UPI00386D02A5|nr:hypothetical protein OG948_21215 [Embleya sp. NBC_00888]
MPAIPTDLLDRIRRAEDSIRQLAGRVNIRPALDQVIDGIVRIGSGGTLRVDRADGGQGLFVGDIFFPYSNGSPQRGMLVRDDQGELVLGIYALGATAVGQPGADVQRLRIMDPDGEIVLSTDYRGGLGAPYLSHGWSRVRSNEWASTASTSFDTLYSTTFPRQHPRVTARIGAGALGGAAIEVRMLANGSPVGSVVSHSGGTLIAYIVADVTAIPLRDELTLDLQARRTGAVGSASATVFGSWGTA